MQVIEYILDRIHLSSFKEITASFFDFPSYAPHNVWNILIFFGITTVFSWLCYGRARSIRALFNAVFPKSEWRKKSINIDIQFNLLQIIGIRSFLSRIIGFVIGINALYVLFNKIDFRGLEFVGPFYSHLRNLDPEIIGTLAFVTTFFGSELGFYIMHRLAHSSPLLWQFHKVHHYQRQLTPLAAARVHPLDAFLLENSSLFGLVVSVLFLGGVISNAQIMASAGAIFSIEIIKRFSMLFVHSHVPISFGFFFNKILVCPRFHQTHHSIEHPYCNYGNLLSIYDWIFATHIMPSKETRLKWGVVGMDDGIYRSIFHAILIPFKDAMQMFIVSIKAWHIYRLKR